MFHPRFVLLMSALLATLPAALLAVQPALGAARAATATNPTSASASGHTSGLPPLPDSSLYLLESRWTRDDGKNLGLADLRGRVRVVSMFFTTCKNICPMIMGELKSLERAMPDSLKAKVGFVLITLDAKDDTQDALQRYRKDAALSAGNWILLRGRPDDTRELSALLGVRFTPKQEDGQMGHTGLIAILDRDGRIAMSTASITDQKAFLARLARTVDAAR